MNTNQQPFDDDDFQYDTTAYDDRMPIDKLRYSAKRNLNDLTNWIDGFFDHYSRILVVRIDLRYKKEVSDAISLETARFHRKLLLEDRRYHPEVFAGLLGCAWGLEYGERGGGYHFHLLALYNGAERRDDISTGMAIGDLWDTITNGCGQCYISNYDKVKLESEGNLGIGMIHRDDFRLRINLIEKVASYITKKCNVFDIKSDSTDSGNFRTFGKTRMVKPLNPNMPRRGRPPVSRDANW